MTPHVKQFLSLREAAEFLGYRPGYLYRLVAARKVPYLKPNNGKLLFDIHELTKWAQRGRVATAEELDIQANAFLARRMPEAAQ